MRNWVKNLVRFFVIWSECKNSFRGVDGRSTLKLFRKKILLLLLNDVAKDKGKAGCEMRKTR